MKTAVILNLTTKTIRSSRCALTESLHDRGRPVSGRPRRFLFKESIMTDQPNNEEHEPIRFTDKRRLDPDTGKLREQDAPDSTPEDSEASEHADPLPQVADS